MNGEAEPPPTPTPPSDVVVQPSSFPTRKVTAFGGTELLLHQAFDVVQDLGVTLVQSLKELLITLVSGVAAWWVKERPHEGWQFSRGRRSK